MNMICVAAAPGWIVKAKPLNEVSDVTPEIAATEPYIKPMSVIAWLIKLDERAGRLVVTPITPWGEPPDDNSWNLINTEYGDEEAYTN
jgi:hypothetical protein